MSPSSAGAIFSSMLCTASCTPFPAYLPASPSLSSSASCSPVEAPLGTAARPNAPLASVTSASTVGLPRESMISRARMSRIVDILLCCGWLGDFLWRALDSIVDAERLSDAGSHVFCELVPLVVGEALSTHRLEQMYIDPSRMDHHGSSP